MSYNKFKIAQLKNDFALHVVKAAWLPTDFAPFAADATLMSTLAETEKVFLGSEKARSEFIIAPILQAFRRHRNNQFSIFSGYEFNIDKSLALNGFCDFILSSVPDSLTLEAPAFFIVETKKTDIDENAIAQCGAELYAAQLFNAQEGKPQTAVYGCVTSGFSWGFLKLEAQTLMIDPNYVPLTFKNPYNVLAALQWILDKKV
jgi:hypothetical protein